MICKMNMRREYKKNRKFRNPVILICPFDTERVCVSKKGFKECCKLRDKKIKDEKRFNNVKKYTYKVRLFYTYRYDCMTTRMKHCLRNKRFKSCFIPVIDNWYGNYDNNTVSITYYANGDIFISGNDDFSMYLSNCDVRLYYKLQKIRNFSKEKAKELGFVEP